MQLIQVSNGNWVRIKGFSGGYSLALKLRQLGLMPGDFARVLRRAPFGGPVLVEIAGRSIALGLGIASQIEVEEVECALL
jgi:ferrous iron transport protein A